MGGGTGGRGIVGGVVDEAPAAAEAAWVVAVSLWVLARVSLWANLGGAKSSATEMARSTASSCFSDADNRPAGGREDGPARHTGR
jgi:hypothetical protein